MRRFPLLREVAWSSWSPIVKGPAIFYLPFLMLVSSIAFGPLRYLGPRRDFYLCTRNAVTPLPFTPWSQFTIFPLYVNPYIKVLLCDFVWRTFTVCLISTWWAGGNGKKKYCTILLHWWIIVFHWWGQVNHHSTIQGQFYRKWRPSQWVKKPFPPSHVLDFHTMLKNKIAIQCPNYAAINCQNNILKQSPHNTAYTTHIIIPAYSAQPKIILCHTSQARVSSKRTRPHL